MVSEVGGFLWREEKIARVGTGFRIEAATDPDLLIASEKNLVSGSLGHGPVEQDRIAGALGCEVSNRVWQFEAGRLRRGDHAASG